MQSYISLHLFTPQDTLGGGLVATFCLTFAIPQTVDHQASLYMGFPRQEYWSGLSFPSPGDLPNPWTEPESPALQEVSCISGGLLLSHQGSTNGMTQGIKKKKINSTQ